ncbi:MAG: cobalamin-dependent protein [Roseiarcus sp.]|jgi:methanogenic corrinoid protein MtbC1
MQQVGFFPEFFTRSGHGDKSRAGCEAEAVEPDVSWQAALGRIIEAEIIPRLMLSQRAPHATPAVGEAGQGADPMEFAQILVGADMAQALSYIDRLRRRGGTTDLTVLDFLASTARCLGTLWESDHYDFVDVTIGLRRLHNLLAEFSPSLETTANSAQSRRAILTPAPGETHIFGVAMVERCFQSAGWRALFADSPGHLASLRANWVDVIGYSLSCDRYLDDLAAAIPRARAASKNPSVIVLVGGAAFVRRPELALLVGADATALDANAAVETAQRLLRGGALV